MHLLSALTKKLGFDLFGNYSYQLTSEQSVKADYMLGTLLEKQDVNKRGNADRKAFPCENGGRHCEKTQNARVFRAFLFIAAVYFSSFTALCTSKKHGAITVLSLTSDIINNLWRVADRNILCQQTVTLGKQLSRL